MKLLFDENLAHTLPSMLSGVSPDSAHVRNLGLESSPDPVVWKYAAANGYAIVTKDADFRQRSLLYGHPPKVIWIRLGNCSTKRIASLLWERYPDIRDFLLAEEQSFLSLA